MVRLRLLVCVCVCVCVCASVCATACVRLCVRLRVYVCASACVGGVCVLLFLICGAVKGGKLPLQPVSHPIDALLILWVANAGVCDHRRPSGRDATVYIWGDVCFDPAARDRRLRL